MEWASVWEGSCEGGKVPTYSETPSQAGTEEHFGISERNTATGVWMEAKRTEFTTEIVANPHFPAAPVFACPVSGGGVVSGGQALRLRW